LTSKRRRPKPPIQPEQRRQLGSTQYEHQQLRIRQLKKNIGKLENKAITSKTMQNRLAYTDAGNQRKIMPRVHA